MMNNQLEPTIQAAGSWILNNVANNQPRLNIEMAGHWVFKLEKPNTQLYTNIQPVRCWEFNSICVCVFGFFYLNSQYPASSIFSRGWLFTTLYWVELPTPNWLDILI